MVGSDVVVVISVAGVVSVVADDSSVFALQAVAASIDIVRIAAIGFFIWGSFVLRFL